MIEEIHEINDELKKAETTLRMAATDYATYSKDAAIKRVNYDVAWASAMLEIKDGCDKNNLKMIKEEKEALAVKQVETVLRECRIAEAFADGAKKNLDTLSSVLSSLQTRAKLLQTEANLIPRQ